MSVTIEVKGLRRRFQTLEAVSGIDFTISAGDVVGFIGANGAGKTTTMRIMATLDIPTSGSISICGYDVIESPSDVRQRIGWMPDGVGTYSNMSVFEYIDFFARAFRLRGPQRVARVKEVMEFTDLTDVSEHLCDRLSKGMKQRLILGRTLLHDPDVLILDEPAAGLDPKARLEFKNLVNLLSREGKTIFISSHILSELGEMCDRLIFIDRGKIVHEGTTESLKFRKGTRQIVRVRVHGKPENLNEWIKMNAGVTQLEIIKDGARIEVEGEGEDTLAVTLRRMIESGLNVFEFHREEVRLEDAFVQLLKEQE